MARDIALIEPDPIDWAGWVQYSLNQMEAEIQNDRKDAAYESMLLDLWKALEIRIEGGKW